MNSRYEVIIAGHRGYSTAYPENTLLSFRKALEIGVDMIEFDLHLTKDKEIVVIHDYTLDRTTNGSGYVRDVTIAELKKLDAGIWFSREFEGEKIPTLDELLSITLGNKKLLYNVEIKEKTYETVDLTINALESAGIIDRCFITCFDANIIKYAYCKYHVKCQGFPGFMMKNFEEGDEGTYSFMYSVGIEKSYLTKELTDFFVDMNIIPWAYCIDDKESTLKIMELGIPLITCNDPVPALELLRGKSRN